MSNDSGQKCYPPSETKLKRLRSEGVVPYSDWCQRFAKAVVFLILVGSLWATEARGLVLEVARAISELDANGLTKAADIGKLAGALCYKISEQLFQFWWPMALVLLVGGLLQTRFMLSFSVVKPAYSLSQTIDGYMEVISQWRLSLLNYLLGLLLSLVIVGLAGISACRISQNFSSITVFEGGFHQVVGDKDSATRPGSSDSVLVYCDVISDSLAQYKMLVVLSGLLLVLAGASSRFVAVIGFYQRYAMTRNEFDEELKESSANQEVMGEMRERMVIEESSE